MNSSFYKNRRTEDVISSAAKILGVTNDLANDFMKVVEGFSGVSWVKVDDWVSLSDIEIANAMGIDNELQGEVLIVSDASYGKGKGAFEVAKESLLDFVRSHLNIFGECLFNGDVIFVDENSIFVFHHAGIWAKFKST